MRIVQIEQGLRDQGIGHPNRRRRIDLVLTCACTGNPSAHIPITTLQRPTHVVDRKVASILNPNPQSAIPNPDPQSPIPNPQSIYCPSEDETSVSLLVAGRFVRAARQQPRDERGYR